jgi:hypothetical protein
MPSNANAGDETLITPNYRLGVAIALIGIGLLFVQKAIGLLVALLGLFLIYQTNNIGLKFTATALEVQRQGNTFKTFPYAEWQNWEIFWSPVPILFYFKEINSIHFLPILFSPAELRACLEKIPKQAP